MESTPLLGKPSTGAVAERWYVLFVTSLMAFLQGGIWNTWGPIAPAIGPVFHLTDPDIALLANWGPICYLLFVFIAAWLIDVRGLRSAMIVTMLFVFTGSGIRCIDLQANSTRTQYFLHAGQFLNGLAGPVAMSTPPVVSSLFFPPNQRATATSIMAVSNYLGVALTFLVGPLLIPNEPKLANLTLNASALPYNEAIFAKRRDETFAYLIGQTAIAGVALIMTLVYFPSKPRHAPSISATKDRTAYWKGFGDVVKNGQFWFLACAYGLMTGVYSGWGSFLAPNLEKVTDPEHAQKLSAYLGFYATLAGCVGGISASLGSDYLGGKMKLILVSLSAGSTVCYLMFQIAIMHPEWHEAVLYATCIVGGLFLNGTIPLFYEAAVEVTYPVAEGSTTCLLTTFNNIGCLIFLFLPNVPVLSSYPSWANWSLVAACAAGVLVMLPFNGKQKRTQVDQGNDVASTSLNYSGP